MLIMCLGGRRCLYCLCVLFAFFSRLQLIGNVRIANCLCFPFLYRKLRVGGNLISIPLP